MTDSSTGASSSIKHYLSWIDSRLGRIQSTFRNHKLLSVAVWYPIAVLSIPLLLRSWPTFVVDEFPVALAYPPHALFNGLVGLIYKLTIALLLFGFIFSCGTRRAVFSLYLLTLIAIEASTHTIGADRIVSVSLYSALIIVIVEAGRQNASLAVDLCRNPALTFKAVSRALLLWSPMLVVLGIGFHGEATLRKVSEQAIYDLTPIDEYCDAGVWAETIIIPCTEMDEVIPTELFEELPIDVALTIQVNRRFLDTQRALLDELHSYPIEKFDYSNRNVLFESQIAAIAPDEVLGIGPGEPTPAERIAADAEIHSLKSALESAFARLTQLKAGRVVYKTTDSKHGLELKFPTLVINQAAINQTTADIQSLERRLQARQQVVADLVAIEKEKPEHRLAELRRYLYQQVSTIPIDRTQLYASFAENASPTERRFKVMAALVEINTNLREQVLSALVDATSWRVHTDGIPETLELEDAAYEALQMYKLCSIQSESSHIFFEDALGEVNEEDPVPINSRPFKCWEYLAGYNEVTSLGVLGDNGSAAHSLAFRESDYKAEIELGLYDAVLQKDAAKADAIDGAIGIGNSVPQRIHLGRDKCGLFHLIGCAKNYGKRKIERGYGSQRDRAFRRYAESVQSRADQGEAAVEELIFEARRSSYEMLSATTVYMQNAIREATAFWTILSSILTFILVFGIIKSILYVLATEVFHESSTSSMTFDTQSTAQGSFTTSPNVILPPTDLRLVSRKAFTNQKQQTKLFPYPFKALSKRIFDFSWLTMNIGGYVYPAGLKNKKSKKQGIEIAVPDGSVIVHWKMREGEEVVFDFRNFYAASENIRIASDVSLRLSTLLLGRFVFHYARCEGGPGDLFLRTTGVSSLSQADISSVHLDTLIAFNRHTRFRTKDDRKITSVFMDGFSIQRLNPGKPKSGNILVSSQYQTSSRIVGAWRFIKTLILPF